MGRLVEFDVRSRQFPVRAALRPGVEFPTSRRWYLPRTEPVLDQGETSSCVGMGVTNELRYTPTPVRHLDERFAIERIYWEAQKIDRWPGGDYPGAQPQRDDGTSVLAGVKAAAAQGWYLEYRWAFGEADLALAVSHVGPAVLGLPWFEGMLRGDDDHYLHPTGAVVGGHCVLAIGINIQRNAYMIANSWSADWTGSDHGRAWITRSDMGRLLADQGEACIPVRRGRPVKASP
jgi:hypothetical protein